MEVCVLEDPACCWCWAFQPAETALLFEFGDEVKWRRVMGGLRDQPLPDVQFAITQWETAQRVSGMPFETQIWKRHVLRTTFLACRVVKAAGVVDPALADRFLRRVREAFYVEQCPVDNLDRLLVLAEAVGADAEQLREHLNSGRADSLFQRDRLEASHHGFGYPTVLLRQSHQEQPVVLQGAVPYREITIALLNLGFPSDRRRKFRNQPDDWKRLFEIRSRLTRAELRQVTKLDGHALDAKLAALHCEQEGPFYVQPEALSRKVEPLGGAANLPAPGAAVGAAAGQAAKPAAVPPL
jgi:protein-disulfide isomerase-like protein with CxxC motif